MRRGNNTNARTTAYEDPRIRFFGKFFNDIMHGREVPAYDIQTKKLTLEKTEKGHFAKNIEAENRTLCINYYMSHKLDTLFVLTAHIVRKGSLALRNLRPLKSTWRR